MRRYFSALFRLADTARNSIFKPLLYEPSAKPYGVFFCKCVQTCKPSSVVNDHLSWPGVAASAQCHLHRTRRAGAECPSTVLLRIGFAEPRSLLRAGELLPRLSTLAAPEVRRYLSVALSLGSPPAAVSRYPCPLELGLSSDRPFRALPAAVQSGRTFILRDPPGKVNRGRTSLWFRCAIFPFSLKKDSLPAAPRNEASGRGCPLLFIARSSNRRSGWRKQPDLQRKALQSEAPAYTAAAHKISVFPYPSRKAL